MNVPIGTTLTSFTEETVSLDSSRHSLLMGKSGVGKSTLLVNLAVSQIRNGDGILFIDPHGDAIDKILRYIPRSRIRDVIYIDPMAKKVPGLNIFDYNKEEDRERAVQSFLTMAKSISGESWGPETERVLNAAADAVVKNYPKPTIIPIHLFLMRPKFRKQLLEKSDDPLLRDFIAQYDEELRGSERMSKFSPAVNKTDKFLRPYIRTIVGQQDSIDFREAMDTQKIVLARLPKGHLGSITASLIGSIIVSHMSIAALQRKANRSPFVVFIDEVHNFVHGIDLPTVLAESRKYGITLFLATQNIDQLPYPSAVFGNCSNLITYRMGGADAEVIAKELGNPDLAQPIVALEDRTFFASLLVNGSPQLSDVVKTLAPLARNGDEVDSRDVIKVSRMIYGKNRLETDKEVLNFLREKVGSPRPSRSSSQNRNRK
jgi:type IV secretory pathway TraG/TraD family ATPase VirD4